MNSLQVDSAVAAATAGACGAAVIDADSACLRKNTLYVQSVNGDAGLLSKFDRGHLVKTTSGPFH